MNDFKNPETLVVAGTIFTAVLGASICLWVLKLSGKLSNGDKLSHPPIPWKNSWLDFWLLVWAAFCAIIASSILAQRWFPQQVTEETVSWNVIWYGLSAQFALGIVIVGAYFTYKMRWLPPANERPTLPQVLKFSLSLLIRYLPVIWVATAIYTFVLKFLDVPLTEQEAINWFLKMDDPAQWMLSAFTAIIIAPVLEELFFRRLILNFLANKIHPTLALLWSSALFAATHFNYQAFVPIFILGILMGIQYLRTGDIRGSILIHALFNGISVLLLGVDRWVF